MYLLRISLLLYPFLCLDDNFIKAFFIFTIRNDLGDPQAYLQRGQHTSQRSWPKNISKSPLKLTQINLDKHGHPSKIFSAKFTLRYNSSNLIGCFKPFSHLKEVRKPIFKHCANESVFVELGH